MQDHTTYDILKDFAGPVAAIIGATVAGTIAFIFGRAQKQIAASQRDIALDKLKYDLFERRYAIYSSLRELLSHVANAPDLENIKLAKMNELIAVIEEAHFFFPSDVVKHIDLLRALITVIIVHFKARQDINIDDTEKWKAMADTLTEDTIKLTQYYAELPARFAGALRFDQLVRKPQQPPFSPLRRSG